MIFLVSIAALVIVSYLTAPPDASRLHGLTYGTLTEEQRRESRSSWTKGDVIASVGVLVAILAAYLYFRG